MDKDSKDLASAIKDILFGKGDKSVENLVKLKRFDEAMQSLNSLSSELIKLPKTEENLNYQKMLIDKLDEVMYLNYLVGKNSS